jgi:hypothetical protein
MLTGRWKRCERTTWKAGEQILHVLPEGIAGMNVLSDALDGL